MAIVTSYATLQTAIADYLARDDLTTFLPNFVQNAENKLYALLNLRNEETALAVSISSGVAAVPTDFKALKFAYINTAPADVLQWVPLDQLYDEYPDRSSTGTACLISREGANFIFGPVSQDGTLSGVYYAKQDPLRTTDPSWYVTNHPEVLLYGSLLEAAPFIHGDERLPVWRNLYQEAVDIIRVENDNAEVAKSRLSARLA